MDMGQKGLALLLFCVQTCVTSVGHQVTLLDPSKVASTFRPFRHGIAPLE